MIGKYQKNVIYCKRVKERLFYIYFMVDNNSVTVSFVNKLIKILKRKQIMVIFLCIEGLFS